MTHTPQSIPVGTMLWRRRWLACGAFLAVLAAVLVWLRITPRTYTATASLTASPVQSLLQSTGNIDSLQETLAQLASSQTVLTEVSASTAARRTVTELRDEVRGTHVTGTFIIRVTVSDRDPGTASQIANAVATVLPREAPNRTLFVFTVDSPAEVPRHYSSPDLKTDLLAGIALALLVAVGSTLLFERLAGTVRTVDELRSATGLDTVAAVTSPSDPPGTRARFSYATADAGVSALRARAVTAFEEQPLGAIVVASVTDRHDATAWLGLNLGLALAQVHHRVLVIDAAPSATRGNSASGNGKRSGMYDVLREDVSLDDAIVPGPARNVAILPAGDPGDGSPTDVLELRFHKLVAESRAQFDAIIVVAPSLAQSPAARILATSGWLLLLVPAETVRPAVVRGLVEELAEAHTPILGSVLIRMRRRR